MSDQKTINVMVKTSDPSLLDGFFEEGESSASILDGASCVLKDKRKLPGAIGTEVVIELLINVTVSISTSLLASWIYDKLSNKGENAVKIEEEYVFDLEEIYGSLGEEEQKSEV